MLSLLHRYILKEILAATGLAMGLFVFVLLLGNLLKDVAGLVAAGKLGILVFLKLVGLLIPYVASYALPLGVYAHSDVVYGDRMKPESSPLLMVGMVFWSICSMLRSLVLPTSR